MPGNYVESIEISFREKYSPESITSIKLADARPTRPQLTSDDKRHLWLQVPHLSRIYCFAFHTYERHSTVTLLYSTVIISILLLLYNLAFFATQKQIRIRWSPYNSCLGGWRVKIEKFACKIISKANEIILFLWATTHLCNNANTNLLFFVSCLTLTYWQLARISFSLHFGFQVFPVSFPFLINLQNSKIFCLAWIA